MPKLKLKKINLLEILDSNGYSAIRVELLGDNGSTSFAETAFSEKIIFNSDIFQKLKKEVYILEIELKNTDLEKVDEKIKIFLKELINEPHYCLLLSLTLAISIASARLLSENEPLYFSLAKKYNYQPSLPRPIFNMFNGGRWGDTNLDFDEFLFIPLIDGSFKDQVALSSKVFQRLGQTLCSAGYDIDTGIEGGYAPDMSSSIQAIELILAAAAESDLVNGEDFGIGLTLGNSHWQNSDSGEYLFKLDDSFLTTATISGLYLEWLKHYPLVYLEDPLANNDLKGWQELREVLNDSVLLASNNLFDSKLNNLRKLLPSNLANVIVVKISDFATLSDYFEYIKLIRKHGYQIALAHNWSEVADDYLADIAVASNVDFIKAGSFTRGERVGKYNRLLMIDNLLN